MNCGWRSTVAGPRTSGQWLTSTMGPVTAASRAADSVTRARHHWSADGYGSACSLSSSAQVSPAARARSRACDLVPAPSGDAVNE
jgi:hypothetical protein